jgi:tetratricopeptide (TPR) repeat protein
VRPIWVAVCTFSFGLISGSMSGAAAPGRPNSSVSPANAVASHLDRGDGLRKAGNYDGALAEYREAVRLDPTCTDGHRDLAIMFEAMEELEAAILENRAVIRLQPAAASAQVNLASVLEKNDDLAGLAISQRR